MGSLILGERGFYSICLSGRETLDDFGEKTASRIMRETGLNDLKDSHAIMWLSETIQTLLCLSKKEVTPARSLAGCHPINPYYTLLQEISESVCSLIRKAPHSVKKLDPSLLESLSIGDAQTV